MSERWIDDFGQVVFVHDVGQCVNEVCTIHNPSDHALSLMPQRWDDEAKMMFRECVHGELHIDVDEPQMRNPLGGTNGLCAFVRQCDKCCKPRD